MDLQSPEMQLFSYMVYSLYIIDHYCFANWYLEITLLFIYIIMFSHAF